MSVVVASSLLSSAGPLILVTQGITGGRLVAGKQVHLRVFLPPSILGAVDRFVLQASHSTLSPIAIIAPQAFLSIENAPPHGPSVGMTVRGYAFARSGTYAVVLEAQDLSGNPLASASFEMDFAPSHDLRVFIVLLQGSAPSRNFLPTPDWFTDLRLAMARVGSMYPVRDCVRSKFGGNRHQGLRYQIGSVPKEAWPNEVGITNPGYWDERDAVEAAAGPNDDHVDVSMLFRPVQVGEPAGGNASYCVPLRQGQVVGGSPAPGLQMSAPTLGQEIGHTLCLVPNTSPLFDGFAHSITREIADPFAYDFIHKRFFPAPGHVLGDVMGVGAWEGADSVALSSFDWNYLVNQSLPNLGSAGRTGSDINPMRRDPCPPIRAYQPRPERPHPPNTWIQIFGSRADGPQWIWTPHGPVPVPGPGPGDGGWRNRGRMAMRSITETMRSLKKARIAEVYLPTEDAPMTIATPFQPELHAEGVRLPQRRAAKAPAKTTKPTGKTRAAHLATRRR